MSKLLRENVAEAPTKRGNRWRVIVAKPGQGSSGNYSEELFRRDAHKILAPGAQSFLNHGTDRNPRDMIGTFPEGSFWDEEEKAVVSELEVFSHFEAFVNEVGPHCGMSIYAMGESDEHGNVTQIIEDRLNGCDLVARPGLVGSGLAEKLYESAIAFSEEKPSSAPLQENGKIKMDEELKEALKGISDALAVLVAKEQATVAETAQVEANDEAIKAAVEAYDAQIDAIESADLTASQVAVLRAEAKVGRDVAPLIEAHQKLKAEILESVKSEDEAVIGRSFSGKVVESAVDLGKAFG